MPIGVQEREQKTADEPIPGTCAGAIRGDAASLERWSSSLAVLAAAALVLSTLAAGQSVHGQGADQWPAAVQAAIGSAVVVNAGREAGADVPRKGVQQDRTIRGTGFVYSADGFIVTAHQVVSAANTIEVVFKDGRKLPATLAGTDTKTDIAVVRVSASTQLAPLRLGDSSTLRLGMPLVVIGNPFGLGLSVRRTAVSKLSPDFIQTDGGIFKGDAGAPLVTLEGEVVGMALAVAAPGSKLAGFGFAVPSSTIRTIADQLARTGTVARGWLGVRLRNVSDDVRRTLEIKEPGGILVVDIAPDGPAAKADLRAGDVILSLNGSPVADSHDFVRKFAALPIDSQAILGVLRQGKALSIAATVGKLVPGPSTSSPSKR